ncbi:MAG: OmpA family protein [Elusimicrobiaceae bacterium]|jgi:chemotaxis protein MotB
MLRRSSPDELENQLNRSAAWAVTYGDLMSYLMIFFLMLFSFSLASSKNKQNRRYEESLANIQKAFGGMENVAQLKRNLAQKKEDELADTLEKSLKDQSAVTIESLESKIKVVLADSILFDSGRAELKPRAMEVLTIVANELAKIPNNLVVEGHTDNLVIRGGKYSSNWELSMSRAYSVIQFFEKNGIPSSRLAGIGYGENRPVGENATPEGRSKNRRIEIYLIKTE